MSRRLLIALVAALMAVTTMAIPASADPGETRTYKVTITNLTGGQLLTPFVVATHDPGFRVFRPGARASHGLQQLAENGGVPVLVGEIEGSVLDVQVAGAAPIAPGETVEVYVQADKTAQRLSLAGMLICTNDGFGGLNSVRLPDNGSRTWYGGAYDAGTEKNTESYTDLVPPCDGLGMTGETNPALAENGKIRHHRGIRGIADLDPATHGWKGPVIKVTAEQVS